MWYTARQAECQLHAASCPCAEHGGHHSARRPSYSQVRFLAAGYPHEAQVLFWMWYDLRPHRLQMVWVLLRRLPAVSKIHSINTCRLIITTTTKGQTLAASHRSFPFPCPSCPFCRGPQQVKEEGQAAGAETHARHHGLSHLRQVGGQCRIPE